MVLSSEEQTDTEGARVEDRSPHPQAPSGEVRKTVTIVFADLVESTAVASQLDPEVFRRVMSRYFEEMRAVVERHGGMVEKYIGDAVMAVFGAPVLHEDDALRAVRAADEMRQELGVLNDELDRTWGVRLTARLGVNTGEVIAGGHAQGHLFVTGEAVNIAKRLEEVAAASEVLIAAATHRLVRDAVLVEPSGERTSKRGETINALRLVAVLAQAPARARRFDSPLVDRERELGTLLAVLRSAVDARTGHLITVLGSAGVGKSRLVQEFVGGLGENVTVLRGRCLPYGEGITYWPLAEVVRELTRAADGPQDSVAAIAAHLSGEEKAELIAGRVAEALGLAGSGGGSGVGSTEPPKSGGGGYAVAGAGQSGETFWAIRKLFEALARQRPLALVFDDLQWAEPTFLDLVEYLADFSRDAAILLLCIARPELLDDRRNWGGGKVNAMSILLEPLSDDDCRRLIANLLDRAPVPAEAETRIAEAADGNALFAEELLAMLIDDGLLVRDDGQWVASSELAELPVPQTINTLLAARLEGLPDRERVVVTWASVEGTVFHRGGLVELLPESLRGIVDETLTALVRKDVIRPDQASFTGDEAYRFRHILIRDAAYRSLPKTMRSELHERFAGWLERTAGVRLGEFEEIVGYHLEQAHRYRAGLMAMDADSAPLAARAAERLESAGRRALARSDLPAAIGLLERATSVLSGDDQARVGLLPDLGAALIEAGRLTEAESVLDEARRVAAAVGDERAEAHALVQTQFLRLLHVEEDATEEAGKTVAEAVPIFEQFDDHRGLCRAEWLRAWMQWNATRAGAAAEAWEHAAQHARRAGDDHARSEILSWVASTQYFGPSAVVEGIRRCEEIRGEVRGHLAAEAATLRPLAGLHAMDGSFEIARELLLTSRASFEELGLPLSVAPSHYEAAVELLAGELGAAEAILRSGYRALEEMGDKAFLSTTAALLAQVVLEQGRDDEADELAATSRELAAGGDLFTQVIWRGIQARVLARRGSVEEAERLAREAVGLSQETDFVNLQGDALLDLAHVLEEAERLDEAGAVISAGLQLYEQKGNSVAAERARARLLLLTKV